MVYSFTNAGLTESRGPWVSSCGRAPFHEYRVPADRRSDYKERAVVGRTGRSRVLPGSFVAPITGNPRKNRLKTRMFQYRHDAMTGCRAGERAGSRRD